MADSFNKKEREKKKKKRAKDKAEKRRLRKEEGKSGIEMMYVDEDGNLTTTPPDPTKKSKIKLEDINISTPKQEDLEPEGPREGVVKFFNNEKGYGFIEDKNTRESFFVHIDSLKEPIRDRDKVLFEVGSGPKGPIALDVQLVK